MGLGLVGRTILFVYGSLRGRVFNAENAKKTQWTQRGMGVIEREAREAPRRGKRGIGEGMGLWGWDWEGIGRVGRG